jgi:hypothetical protein
MFFWLFELKFLRRELEETAASKKKHANRERQDSQEVQGPMLLIQGKSDPRTCQWLDTIYFAVGIAIISR